MTLDYRPKGARQPAAEITPLERAERRGWMGMGVSLLGFLIIGMVMLLLLSLLGRG
jgi:hypothetical protein